MQFYVANPDNMVQSSLRWNTEVKNLTFKSDCAPIQKF